MFIFKMLDFGFRLLASVIFVLMLQISVGGRTLEDYLMSFIHRSDSLAPVRDIAYSSVRRINPNVQIKSAEERTPLLFRLLQKVLRRGCRKICWEIF